VADKDFVVKNGLVVANGNISVTGTVDGRDVATDGTKLDGIESGATADQTASEILTAIKTVDGAASGLDADLLDGQQGTYYLDFTNATNIPDPNISVTLSGDVTGSANTTLTNLANGAISVTTDIANSGVTSGAYGSASLVPVITVAADGRITSATTVSVAGVSDFVYTSANNTFVISTADGGSYPATISALDGNLSVADLAVTTINRNPTLTLAGDVSGSATFTNLANTTLTVTVADDSHNHIISNVDGLQTALDAKLALAGGTMTGDLLFGDNVKANFGAGSDLQIYHDGLNSYIADTATGSLHIKGTHLFLEDADGNEFIRMSDQGSGGVVYLKNLGATKLTTTATGIDVTGTATATAFSGPLTGNVTGNASTATALQTSRAIQVSGAVTGTANFDGSSAINIVTTATSDPTITLAGDLSGSVTLTNLTSGTLTATVGTLNQNTTGNAATATTLQTARTIGGVSFDGSANINLPGVNTTGNQNTTGSAATLTTARAIQVSGAVTGTANFDGSAAINIVTTHTADPVITLTGAVTGSGTMTNLGSVSIATTATADPTLTLAGDATGSATFTNLGNATLTVAIVDDSHNHSSSSGNFTTNGTFYGLAGTTFDPPGGSGTDTSTTAAFALDSGSAIVGVNNGYIRNMLSWTSSSDITIGQGGTSLIGGINLIPGSSGNVKVNGQRVFAEDYHPNADQWTNSRTVTFATGDVTGNFSIDGSGDVSDVALTVGDDSHNHSSSSGNFTVGGNLTVTGDTITMGNVSTRDKYRVWSNAPYSIGMQNSFTFGALNTDYAMTFQMNDDANRGFWWGDASHTQAQGAMALSTGGKLTVANSVRLGYGEGDTTVPGATYALDVSGEAYISANTTIGGSLQIDGDLTVSGNTVTINVTDLAVEDNMIYLNSGSVVTNPDLGFAGNYNDGTYAHAGFFRDATDGYFKPFKGYTLEPDASAFIDTSHASFALADIQAANFRGALVGNASTATTLQTARTIGGVSFNGSANIDLPGVNTAGNQNTSGNAASATILQTARTIGGVSFNGSANINLPGVNTAGNQNTSGNAASATTLQTARTIALSGAATGTATSFNGGANITIPVTALNASDLSSGTVPDARISGSYTGMTNLTGTGNVDFAKFLGKAADVVTAPSYSWTGDTNTGMWHPGADQIGFATGGTSRLNITTTDITSTLPITASTFTGALSGNATTATTLQTARTIGGVSFNGSANIDLPGVNTAGTQNTSGNAATATTLQTTRTINGANFNGSANIVIEPYVEDAVATSVTRYITFVDNSTAGYKRLNEDSDLTYNPGTNTLTVPTVVAALTGNATTATTLQTARTINGVSFNGSANITVTATATNALTIGSYLTGTSYNGSSAVTIAVSAATVNTVSTVVARDASGNFSAGTVTASLSGNATTATTLQTARTIGMSGVTATATSFNGSANITIPVTAVPATLLTGTIADARISGSYTGMTNLTGTGNVDFAKFLGNAADLVTAPSYSWTGDDNTGMWRPGADQIGFATAGVSRLNITTTDITSTLPITASTFTGALVGNASTATSADTLTTARTIGGVSFNGSANINLPGVNTTGNQNTSGNAATATALQTARTINGVSFNGTANITVADATKLPLAGGTMTGLLVGKTATTTTVASANDTGSFSVRGNATYPAVMSFHRAGAYAVNFGLSTDNKMELGGWSATTIKHTWDMATGNYDAVGTITGSTFNATSTTNGGFQGIDADSLTSPSFTWTSDQNTGMWNRAADQIGFSTGGNDEFFIATTYTQSLGSSRAPIFYDSNDTAYYVDPNSLPGNNSTSAGARLRDLRVDRMWQGVPAHSGPILTYTLTSGGTGYTNGTYTNLVLSGGQGVYATFDFTVAGGIITVATLTERGSGFQATNTIAIPALGGTGSGGLITVDTVRTVDVSLYNSASRIRLASNDTTITAGQEIGGIYFNTRDASAGGGGDKAYILGVGEGTSGGGAIQFWTSTNGGGATKCVEIAGNNTFRLFNAAGTFYHSFDNAPTANRTLTLPNATGTIALTSSSITGSAASLTTARTIALSGAATGTATSFNGTDNITIPVTALNASNLNAGTVPDARISGSYTGMTNLTGTGNVDFAKFLGNAADLVTAPSYSWTGDDNTGMWRPGADQIGFATNGVSRLNITTTAITSTLAITAPTFTGALSGNATTATTATTATSAGNADTVDSLHASSFFRSDTSNQVDARFASGDGRGMRFWDSDSYKIWMSSASNTTYGGRISGETTSDYNMYFRMNGGTNRGFVFESAYATKLLSINPAGVNTGLTINAATFNATSTTNGGFQGIGADDATNPSFTWSGDLDTGLYRPGANQVGFTTAGVSRFVLTNTTATFTGDVVANSDIRLKKDIENITDALEKVNKLNGVNFTKIENDRRSTGLIAQDVQAVLPEAVAENEEGYLSVAYGNMVGLLVEAIKEQDSTINSLRNDVETLKELVNKLMETR
jgi:hypothetical protein